MHITLSIHLHITLSLLTPFILVCRYIETLSAPQPGQRQRSVSKFDRSLLLQSGGGKRAAQGPCSAWIKQAKLDGKEEQVRGERGNMMDTVVHCYSISTPSFIHPLSSDNQRSVASSRPVDRVDAGHRQDGGLVQVVKVVLLLLFLLLVLLHRVLFLTNIISLLYIKLIIIPSIQHISMHLS